MSVLLQNSHWQVDTVQFHLKIHFFKGSAFSINKSKRVVQFGEEQTSTECFCFYSPVFLWDMFHNSFLFLFYFYFLLYYPSMKYVKALTFVGRNSMRHLCGTWLDNSQITCSSFSFKIMATEFRHKQIVYWPLNVSVVLSVVLIETVQFLIKQQLLTLEKLPQ